MYVRYIFDAFMGFDPDFLPYASVYIKSYSVDDHMRRYYILGFIFHNLAYSEDSVSESFDSLIFS